MYMLTFLKSISEERCKKMILDQKQSFLNEVKVVKQFSVDTETVTFYLSDMSKP